MSVNPNFMQEAILSDKELGSPIFDRYEVLPASNLVDNIIKPEVEKQANPNLINPATPQSSPGCYDFPPNASEPGYSPSKNHDALLSSIDTSEQQYLIDLTFSLLMHIYNYLMKKSLPLTAQSLLSESGLKLSDVSLIGNTDNSFIKEWWDVFWDVYLSKISTPSTSSSPGGQIP